MFCVCRKMRTDVNINRRGPTSLLLLFSLFCAAESLTTYVYNNQGKLVDRVRRQETPEICDFGAEGDLLTCDWANRNGSMLQWQMGAGTLSNWLGGPHTDAGQDPATATKGGYIFFETSLLGATPDTRVAQNAFLDSPVMGTSGVDGNCVAFSYHVDGLSAAGLRVLLHPLNEEGLSGGFDRVLWSTKDPTNQRWMEAEVLYTYNKDHQIVFEGLAKDASDAYRRYRGFVAVDNVAVKPGRGGCRGHCTFEGDFCGWTNDEEDDFEWFLRQATKILDETQRGKLYIVIPSSPDSPMCMRFWTHMYGNGIGTLSILLSDTKENKEKMLWSLSGEAGNAWYQAELPISSPNPFMIVIQGMVGRNNLGDIAIDDLSLTHGSCPRSRAWFTFQDIKPANTPQCMSFWFVLNEPFIDNTGPSLGSLTVYTRYFERNGNANMTPVWRLYNHQGPEWRYAQAMIPETAEHMHIVIEGTWGSSRANGFIGFDDITFFGGACSTLPSGAFVRVGECRFERDTCDWFNDTSQEKTSASWRLATVSRRPANLPDKTFGAPEGYVYFDLFNQNVGSNVARLISPPISGGGEDPILCFSFWFAVFGAGESAELRVVRQDNSSVENGEQPPMEKGQATNGGFAVDDLTFSRGTCSTRPPEATVKNQELK
ncbi:hypothetical protein C0J52_10678 [Blattella germanica]|nr:hypothetical protein C0J52_10678 [Blattella germanica]